MSFVMAGFRVRMFGYKKVVSQNFLNWGFSNSE